MQAINMILSSWFTKMVDLITGFFAIIPQIIYFIYASCASFLDLLQYLIRKLAGLDVYYVNGEATSGDIVTSFIKGILGINKSEAYSALSTVFWSLVIFGVILLVLTTIFSIIKAHYNYDSKKSHPLTIIGASLKSLSLMAIVPLVAIFGLYISQVLLQTLDEITTYNTAGVTVFEKDADGKSILTEAFEPGYIYSGSEDTEKNTKVYSSYDFFDSVAYTNTATFSGAMFKIAAYNSNRVRSGFYSTPNTKDFSKWDNFGIFYSEKSGAEGTEAVASQIDYAFSNTLTLKEEYQKTIGISEAIKNKDFDWKFENEDTALVSSYCYSYGALTAVGLIDVECFSKFNVGLVYYYYNLWGFNFLIAFAGIFAFITILGNVVFGLITRLIQLLALFFVFPPLIGITPLDDGKAFKEWRKQFISDVIMAFGAIIGMNIFFIILPFLNTISFFNVVILDGIMNIIIMLAGLTMVKNLIKMISSFIGGGDANAIGEDTRKATAELGMKGFDTVLKAGNLGVKAGAAPAKFFGAPFKAAGGRAARFLSRESRDRRFVERHGGGKSESEYVTEAVASGRTAAEGRAAYASDQAKINNRMNRRTTRERVVKSVGRTAAKGLTIALLPFGSKIERDSSGNFDGVKSLKAFGTATLDITNAGLKLGAGTILKGSSVYKSAEEKGVVDSGKTAAKTFFNSIGVSAFDSSLKTKKDKDSADKNEVAAERSTMTDIKNNSKEMLDELRNLASRI